MAEITIESLVDAGFPQENFPEDLPEPGTSNITMQSQEGQKETYRYQVEVGGHTFAMEVCIDRATIDDPSEGVGFMLNQFAYLWRMDKPKILMAADGTCRRIDF